MIWMKRTTAIPAVAATILIAFSLAAGPEHAAPATSPTDTVKPTPVFKVEEIASGLRAPWAIAFLPDGRVFFTERVGRVRVIENGRLRAEPVLTVPDIKSWTKMGLLGLAISPNFAADHLVFLAENYGDDAHNSLRVVRYREESGKLIEPTKLIDGIPAYLNHTGGRLRFGPDGKLYITTGDADKPPLAQDLRSLAGKILRLNADGSIPDDNPFVGRSDAHPAVWSYGHRNSQGLAFQPGSDTLFAPEHGPDGGDEINIVRRGANYGWPVVSHDRSHEGMISPLLQYTPSIAPAAATFYTGDLFPSLKGDLLVACLRGEGIVRVQLDGEHVITATRLLYRQLGRLREVAVAPDGSIWLTTSEFDPPEGRRREGYDKILRLTPTGAMAAGADAIPAESDAPRPVSAAAMYAARCAGCHGDDNGPGLHSSLFDGKWILGSTDDDLRRAIHDGVMSRGMPAFGDKLTEAQIADLLRYIRQHEREHAH